ncbi:uncharacterized protein LOC126802601 [Argentina anserina]|uniref:uncharacterized protein LOC126802601 n=1 Tax=Argentina anserina TaxID=57926 RepID=UPI0021763E7F|nr:uncharacterized protein LOC126802601 [Potentilla anserina]
MFKALFWNARGAGSENFKTAVRDLIKLHCVDILAICEPRVQFSRVNKAFKDMGLSDNIIVEARGFSGGLWLLWDRNKVQIDYIDDNSQSISVKISIPGKQPWLFIVIYASPTHSVRAGLWSYLDQLVASVNLPCTLMGDFNELVSADDKNFGHLSGRFVGLRDWVNRNGMIDMGFQGSKYTWSNNRIKERLDRGFCCPAWRILFAEAFIKHLPKTRSDHCPILLQLYSNNLVNKNDVPFRFQVMWMNHNMYADFVSSSWNSSSGDLSRKISYLSAALSKWNKDVFGHLFHRKRHILARLGGIQKACDRFENHFLLKLEAELIKEYEGICEQENLYWRQNLEISGYKKKITVDFFINLFSGHSTEDSRFLIDRLFPAIDQQHMAALSHPITLPEVKQALFSIGALKAPGHDDAFKNCSIPQGLNHTIITLVPKVEGPQHMVNFRPISLCTTIYKVISKIIVARIRPLMMNLISPNQVSYVPGRNISDNIMVAQEILFKFKKSSGKQGFFAWKVDLSKAYDRLSWNFIEMVLYDAKFPHSLVKLIMHCISSVSFQISLNGELSESFQGQRGIRQGDPLSPYIFVLCMEKLSHLINTLVDDGLWKPVRASQSGPKISHLFFADDLIFFAEASISQANALKKCLDIFCALSGQAVSYEKSLIYCSPNTCSSTATCVSRICGSPLTNDLGKYLGMPLIHERVNHHTYAGIYDKFQSRLSSWKSKTLSMAGRLVLIQSVSSAIPNYAMQTARFPVSLCDKLDKLNRDFLWGDTEDKKKIHLVNWETVCKPKILGGLGIKRTYDMNQAMLAKASWRIWQNDPGIWNTIFKEKYLKHYSIVDNNYQPPSDCSSTWRGVVHGAQMLRQGLKWRVGDGKTIKFRYDPWLTPNALISHVIPNAHVDHNATVCDFWDDLGWNIDLLSTALPDDIVNLVINTPTGFEGCGDDVKIWSATSNGIFSVKSAYNSIFNFDEPAAPHWKALWSFDIPPKQKTFLWVILHKKLLTNEQRVRRGLANSSTCTICNSDSESLLHLFRDCSRVTWRNKAIFDPSFSFPFNPGKIITDAAVEWKTSTLKAKLYPACDVHMFSWIRPPEQFLKLNVDGTRSGQSGKIGAGGVIRDHNGNWVSGFQINLGVGAIIEAEAWSLYYGLKLAHNLHISKLEIESDSAILINLLKRPDLSLHPLGSLIAGCHHFISSMDETRINHIFRESNMTADSLAKCSIDHAPSLLIFEDPPVHAISTFMDDLANVSRPRKTGIVL